MDHYLKSADAAELQTALIAAGILVAEADDYRVEAVSLDIIGQISKPTGATITVDGIEAPEMAALDGYHANLRGDLTDAQREILAPLLLPAPPAHPFRAWA